MKRRSSKGPMSSPRLVSFNHHDLSFFPFFLPPSRTSTPQAHSSPPSPLARHSSKSLAHGFPSYVPVRPTSSSRFLTSISLPHPPRLLLLVPHWACLDPTINSTSNPQADFNLHLSLLISLYHASSLLLSSYLGSFSLSQLLPSHLGPPPILLPPLFFSPLLPPSPADPPSLPLVFVFLYSALLHPNRRTSPSDPPSSQIPLSRIDPRVQHGHEGSLPQLQRIRPAFLSRLDQQYSGDQLEYE